MASGQPQAGGPGRGGQGSAGLSRTDPGRTVRIALTAVLLCVVLAGVRAAIPEASWTGGPWRHHGLPVGIGLEAVLIALLVAVEVRRRRHPESGLPATRLRDLLRAVLLAGVIVIPVLILINSAGKLPPAHPHRPLLHLRPPRHPGVARPPHATSGGGGPDWSLILYIVLLVALLAAVAGCVILLRRRTRRASWDEIPDLDEETEPAGQLRQAVASGQAALGEIDDARLAIIACYAAMERSLARAGAERGAAETPDELLDRAAAAGLVQGAEAGRLTALFYEARFSSHPLPAARRDEAREALAVLAEHLDAAARREAAAAAAAAVASSGDPGSQADGRAGSGSQP